MIYTVRCIIEMKTPLHCGEQTDGILDDPVTHDPFGFWRIPGSSIAGVLRSYAHEYFPEQENALFGQIGTENCSSKVWCSDAILLDYDQNFAWKKVFEGKKVEIVSQSYIRDHVSLDLKLGSSIQGGKFDEEYVPAGTRFALEIKLDGWLEKVNPETVQAFAGLIQSFKDGNMKFGAHSNYDYGTYQVIELDARKFDLTNAKELEQWLQIPDTPLFPKDLGLPFDFKVSATKEKPKDSISGTLDLPLCTDGPILIAGGSPTGSIDADLCFARTAVFDYKKKEVREHLIIPGSSLRGVIRHRIYQILESQKVDNPLEELENLFGCAKGSRIIKGKLGVADAEIYNAKELADMEDCQIIQHVSIDRFTGGAMDSHLFNEAPLWQKHVSFVVHLNFTDLAPKQAALLLHALIDFAEGKLSIGNGVRRGNGHVYLDSNTPIACNLTWNGEKLNSKDHDKAKQWLAKIARA